MGNKISNQERENVISSDDLLLISKSLNEYNSAWKSKAINFDDFAESMNREFRNRKFKDVLDTIQEIYNTYLNSGNLSINFNKEQKEIQLISEEGVFSKFDASELIFSGMIKDVKRIQKDGKPYIRFEIYINDGKEVKEIDIPLGDFIDIYTAGNGLCCVDKEFSINEDIVATNEYVNEISTLLDNEIGSNYKELTSTISSVSSSIEQDIDVNYNKLTTIISSTSSDLEQTITENYDKLNGTISTTSSTLDSKIDTIEDKLVKTISNISSTLDSNIDNTYDELINTISSISDDIESDIETTKNKLTTTISSISTDINGTIDRNYIQLTTTISSISSDIENNITEKYSELTITISSVSSDLSTEISTNYAKKTEHSTYTNGKGLDLNGNEFSVKDEISATAFSEATSWVNNQNYTTYENVKTNLSNDGYSMKVIFRDWEE